MGLLPVRHPALLARLSQAGSGNDEKDEADSKLIRILRRVIPTSHDYDGDRLTTKVNGKRLFTPLFLVMVAIGLTDVLFALDSIPAIFGLTQEAYIVFTANAFSLLGLRQLYFLISGLLERLVYLAQGLAVILASSASSSCSTPCTSTRCRLSTAVSPSTGFPRSRSGSRSASSC